MESNDEKSEMSDVKLEESQDPSTSSSSARPKRATKKNVRYSNADFVTSSEAPPEATTASSTTTSGEGAEPKPSGAETPKGRRKKVARRSNEPPTLPAEPELTDGSQMDVAMEYEIPHDGAVASEDVMGEVVEGEEDVEVEDVEERDPDEVDDVGDDDDGPPVLGTVEEEFGEGEESDVDEMAPDLERNPLTRKRGRPRNIDSTGAARAPRVKPSPRVAVPVVAPSINLRLSSEARVKNVAAQQNVRLFMPELETTPDGDTYATVVPGCLTELLRKERVIELLTNELEIEQIRASGWLLSKPPRLPPLTTEKACFAFYVDGRSCKNAKELSNDDLRPWTAVMDTNVPNSVNIKPNVRRHAVARLGGQLKVVRSETRLAEYHLTEYNARLPREQRLKKKIFYLSRDHQIYGNVLILYEYMREGVAPAPINLPHGNDYLRRAAVQDVEQHAIDGESPFEEQPYEGDRGGLYMKLRPGRLAWAHNKKNLLDYMYNIPYLTNTIVLNTRLPDLPPLIETAGVFAYFAHSENIANQIHHAPDGLSPWTVNPIAADDEPSPSPAPRVRSTRRALITDADGLFSLAKDQKMSSSCVLVETLSTLARCKRVRKRVFYIQHVNTHIVGNVCYLYEFVCEGRLPTILTPQEQRQISHMGGGGRRNTTVNTPTKHARFDETMIELDDTSLAPIDDVLQNDPEAPPAEVVPEGPTEEEQMAMYPDTLNGGFDTDFADDQLEKSENPEPYYDVPRQLSTGHIYLTVRHKKVVTGLDHVMEWIANSNFVEDRGLLNQTKPVHPPMVTNARAYAFFVAGAAIFPHDINRDDFSPWSGNGNSENLTRYRSKVRKIGCAVEPNTSTFMLKDHIDYKMCQFHLVYLYSTNPRDPRMRKKIYYIMETESKMVVSHALIIYDYTSEGRIPKLSAGQYKSPPKRQARINYSHATTTRDPADDEFITEEHRVSPFNDQPMEALDGTMYMAVIDKDFWTDRNRQIQFLVNEPLLIPEMGCLNEKVPDMPPSCTTKGLFVFFVNMNEINIRSLTIDKLVPWSENVSHGPHGGPTIRPKSSKSALHLNTHGQLRVSKTQEHSEYQIHTYTATLPRCTRLRKKVVYVLRNGGPFGNAMIMYSFTENGDDPLPLLHKSLNAYAANDDWYHLLTPMVREDVDVYMRTMNLSDVKKSLYEVHGLNLSRAQLYALQSSQQPHPHHPHHHLQHHHHRDDEAEAGADEDVEIDVDGYAWPTTTTQTETSDGAPKTEDPEDQLIEHGGHEMMVEEEIIVGHTETVPYDEQHHHHHQMHARQHPFLDKNVTNTGFVRGSQRNEALWRIAQKQFGVDSIDQTFDGIFKLLYQRDEQRLLHNINVMFNVDIVSGEDDEQQIIDDPQYMHHHHHGGDEEEMMVVEEEEVVVTVDGAPAEYMEQVVVEEEEVEHVMI